MSVSRRSLLKTAGGLIVGLGIGAVAGTPKSAAAQSSAGARELPWPYKKLDPDAVAERGYAGYYKGACCFGAFDGVVGELQREVGGPYNTFPNSLMGFGEGGVAGMSTLCGALNGAAMAIFLTVGGTDKERHDRAFVLIRELYNWYERSPLPDYRPKKMKFEIVSSISRSQLCHVSVANWCKESKFKSFSSERAERCAWIAASVARKTAIMLNENAEGTFKAAYPLAASVQACRSCHDQGGSLENSRGMMDCGGCHFTGKSAHPKI